VFVVLAGMAVVAFVLAGPIMDALVQRYTPSERALTVELTRIMLLQPIFLGLQAIVGAILQTYHRFLMTAVAPLVYNLAVVVGALLFGGRYGVGSLAWSVTVGAFLMLAVQIPNLPRPLTLNTEWASPPVREITRLMGPRVVGLAAFQAMLFITLYLAQGLPQGMVAAVNFSWVLIYFPVGALGTAAATALFPTLSRLSTNEELEVLRRTVNRSLRLLLFLSLPSAVGLIVLRRPIINLLYAHGTWTRLATEQTAFALIFYALALAPLTVLEMLPRVFYAMKDTMTPVRIAILAVTIDAVLSIVLVHVLPRTSGQGGLALATAVATTLQAGWLASRLDVRLRGGIGRRSLVLTLRDVTLASLAMGMAVYIALDPLTALIPDSGFGALVITAIGVGLGGAVFWAACQVIGLPELEEAKGLLLRRRE
jgi:putative peptidoglycan lipid II flippase